MRKARSCAWCVGLCMVALLAGQGPVAGGPGTEGPAAPEKPPAQQQKDGAKKKKPAFDHSEWGKVLKAHMADGWVDYAGIVKEPAHLNRYMVRLAGADLRKLKRNDRMALYINAYNAFTVKLITDYYWESVPDKATGKLKRRIDSIKDISSRKRWKAKRWNIGGEAVSLQGIEHDILRKQYKDARVHFALNCASLGCPDLTAEPYDGEKLSKQLDAAARAFHRNTAKGLRLDRAKGRVYVSKIYRWFDDDFEDAAGSVPDYAARYAPKGDAAYIRANRKKLKVKYLDYDWGLNDVKDKPRKAPVDGK
ncbi:MAG: DUF547 domain-containing protein [Candidatus Brocadiia bacterium]|nr:DUF547 domain-containing protein [Candidatus Brocadiia bacterium]